MPGRGPGETNVPFLDQPPAPPPPLAGLNQLDWEAQTPDSWITPNEKFFRVGHYGVPEVDAAKWKLEISGLVANPRSYDLAAIKALPKKEVVFTLECSGNNGFPFLQGAANVYRVTRSGKVSVWASGLTNVVGVAAARDGLYVAQMTQTGLPEFGTFANGSIIKISWWNPNKRTVVASGLSSVGGVEVGKDGTVYATTNSVVPGGGTVIAIKQH